MGRDDVKAAVTRLRHNGRVRLAGLQFFSGTQKNSLKRLARELRGLDAFIQELEQDCGWRVPELEFGPGFPVSYFTTTTSMRRSFCNSARLSRACPFMATSCSSSAAALPPHAVPTSARGRRQGERGAAICHRGRRHAPARVLRPIHGHEATLSTCLAPMTRTPPSRRRALEHLRLALHGKRHPCQAAPSPGSSRVASLLSRTQAPTA